MVYFSLTTRWHSINVAAAESDRRVKGMEICSCAPQSAGILFARQHRAARNAKEGERVQHSLPSLQNDSKSNVLRAEA